MAKLSERTSNQFQKILLIGDSGSGKTGALASLALAGYKLVILDFDAGTDILVPAIKTGAKSSTEAAEAIGRIDVETFTDEYTTAGTQLRVKGVPKAFSNAMKSLTNFPGVGALANLGQEHIVVIDSLSLMSQTCFNYVDATTSYKDGRQTFMDAQKKIEMVLQMLYSAEFKTNVIVTSHITFIEVDEGIMRGYPMSMGRALSPKIPRMFNTTLECKTNGAGSAAKRYILTKPSGSIEVKCPVLSLPARLPQETGLATFFEEFKKALVL